MKRIIGLTGGIATGKTTVANYLAIAYNLPILDADIYARDAVSVGSPILNAIYVRYSKRILLPDGNLNRSKLGEIIFNSEEERHWVENLIHPYVRQRFVEEIATSPQEIVLAIPLLFEAKMTDLVTEIWVVTCPKEQQIQRLIQRDRLTYEQALSRINSQMPIAEKEQGADIILDNSSSKEALLQQVETFLHRK
ncbi:MAG: dephospho-CoA kinase [Cyanomargarita calcarea GSE-NOS-MK-12-04C]|jgi:dephospho-CoA kinase|uniref:Dephospho-CoA kinase n=1 Tax=Cyanomargarita calcarea GSE-NOS-MK-12-04C TaxID=2839659 RepID=A0A951QR30_9CYAN|nr:dephospho-CoA kinase [Cyanomargarita calcarea GSE-NOS-MK-12-04C]